MNIRQQQRDLDAVIQKERGQVIGDDIDATDTVTLTGATDALAFAGLSNVYLVNSAGVDAMTLATPVAGAVSDGGDDGKELMVIDIAGHAHTITTAANKIDGNKHVATYGGTAYSVSRFVAAGGIWVHVALVGVTLS